MVYSRGNESIVYHRESLPNVFFQILGNALSKAVQLAEVLKRRFAGLYQVTSIGSTDIVDEYVPNDGEEDLENVTQTKTVSIMTIKLSKTELKSSDIGYQAPIDQELVNEVQEKNIFVTFFLLEGVKTLNFDENRVVGNSKLRQWHHFWWFDFVHFVASQKMQIVQFFLSNFMKCAYFCLFFSVFCLKNPFLSSKF